MDYETTARQRLMGKVTVDDNGCWIINSACLRHGYRVFWVKGMPSLSAHRNAYTLFRGPIPAGLVIDHLCKEKACVNPNHLEAVTQAENVRRGNGDPRWGRAHCKRGHLKEGDNLYLTSKGHRICVACSRASSKIYKAKKKLNGAELE